MSLDLTIVLIVAIVAVALNPDTEAFFERFCLALRYWRNHYPWRAAWRLSERR